MGDQSNAGLPGDKRFFSRVLPIPIDKLAEVAQATVVPPRDGALPEAGFVGVAPLQAAGPSDVSFLDNRRYVDVLTTSLAGLVIISPAFVDKVPAGSAALVTSQPYLAWARISSLFHPAPDIVPGVHPTAVIDPSAQIDAGAQVGAFAVVGANVEIGNGTIIGSHVSIGAGVRIGERNRIGANVTISHALLGDRVTIFPGARIGQEGFGFAVGPNGFETVPQLGRVLIEDGVEIGANSTIDRGSAQDTVIGAGTRIDNLVQIGHNARLGRCCIVVSQAGISGSTELGDFVTIAAQAGLIGHIKIGTKARVGAQCGVMSDVDAGADVIGSPAMPFREFFRNVAVLRKLAKKSGGIA